MNLGGRKVIIFFQLIRAWYLVM